MQSLMECAKEKLDVNVVDSKNRTYLMIAAQEGDITFVKYLLSMPECDANLQDHKGNTALMLALEKKNSDVAKLILSERGCNLSQRNLEQYSAWHYAINCMDCDIVEKLVELGRHQEDWSINERSYSHNGYTALHGAVYLEDNSDGLPLTRLLLRLGADPFIEDNFGWNVIRYATGVYKYKALALFLNHPSVLNAKGWGQWGCFNAIHIAVTNRLPEIAYEAAWSMNGLGEGKMEVVEKFVFERALSVCCLDLVKILMENNCKFPATMTIRRFHGLPANYIGMRVPIFEYTVVRGFFSIARLLFEAGAKVSIRFCPKEDRYFSHTFGRFEEYPLDNREDEEESGNWLKDSLSSSTPRRLQLLCRSAIRNAINVRFQSAVQTLEIPEHMKTYVSMEEEFKPRKH